VTKEEKPPFNVGDGIALVGCLLWLTMFVLLIASFWKGWQFAATAGVLFVPAALFLFGGIDVSNDRDKKWRDARKP
jgi:hypothetical protein